MSNGIKRYASEQYVNDLFDTVPKQVQVDWNQNDKNSSSYIENRPFYSYEGYSNIIFDNDISLQSGGQTTEYYFSPALPIVEGEECLIEFNNEHSFLVKCGEEFNVDSEHTSTVGYKITLTSEFLKIFWYASTQYHLKIAKKSESIKQLDEKFIPDTIARKDELNELSHRVSNIESQLVLTDENTDKKYKLTVVDGKLTMEEVV